MAMPQIIDSINSHSFPILPLAPLTLSLIHLIILTNLMITHRRLMNLLPSYLFWLAIYYFINLIGIACILVAIFDRCWVDMYFCDLLFIIVYIYICICICVYVKDRQMGGWMCRFIIIINIMISYLLAKYYGNTFWNY